MRRREDGTTRARAWWGRLSSSCLLVLSSSLVLASTAAAQRGIAREAALYMVLPLGARIVASGQSVASPDSSHEQLHWNPAGIARAQQREIAGSFGRFYVGPMSSVGLVVPFERAGVVGASVAVLDYGSQETGDATGPTGTASQHSYLLSATYAATIGARTSIGFTFKRAMFVGSCSGLCPSLAIFSVSTSAVDAGLQFKAQKDGDVVLGVAIRNAGPRLQVNDEAQADPLPTRVQLGGSVRVRAFEREVPSATMRVHADLIDRAQDLGDYAPRVGVELTWRGQASVRAGYVVGSGEGTGFGAGLGVVAGRAIVDVGQTLGGDGDASRHSVYLSLKYVW